MAWITHFGDAQHIWKTDGTVLCRMDEAPSHQQRADRALIVAAPDLLAVLERVAGTVNGLSMSAELWDDMHAAIAKAKGK